MSPTQFFVLCLIFMVFVVPSLTKIYLSSRERDKHARLEEQARESAGEMTKRLEELEDRIRVLERIVTDERYELRQRFKELSG